MNSMKRQKDRKLKDELPRLVGAQYATEEEWRNNSRKNEETKPKQKQHPAVGVTGDRGKVWCCKEQYCIGTWTVRSMNQGKLEAIKQEMARVNVDILGISKLKWTGIGEFNSDDHYIYYCGQESLRRNGVAITVNKSPKCSTWMLDLMLLNCNVGEWRADSFEKTLMLGKMKAGGEGDDRGWDGWMASLTQWTWLWVKSGSFWWTGRPGVLHSMGSQRVRQDWMTELNWTELNSLYTQTHTHHTSQYSWIQKDKVHALCSSSTQHPPITLEPGYW